MTQLSTWVGVREAAKLLGWSEWAVRDAVSKKILPAAVVGKSRIKIARADLNRIVNEGLGAAQSAPAFDAGAVARELRIMELESRIERDQAELSALRKKAKR